MTQYTVHMYMVWYDVMCGKIMVVDEAMSFHGIK